MKRQVLSTLLVFITATAFLYPYPLHADIYRFVTIDGIETFTDSPLEKAAKVVIKEKPRVSGRPTAQAISRESKRSPSPSLHEIIERTVQAQLTPGNNWSGSPMEALLPVQGIITSGVGVRIDPIDGQWRHHNGIDIAVPTGTPVIAIADGVAVYSGFRSGYGWTVLLEHDNGMVTLYGHNSTNSVAEGQLVKKGETIAFAGSTGRSTGPHVHFEAWQSGANITAAFMPGSSQKIASSSTPSRRREQFRRVVLSDGSLLITNLPATVP